MDGMSKFVGRDRGVSMATGYGLDGPGIESQWGRVVPQPSGLSPELTQPTLQRVPGLFPGDKAAGAWR
jgi:hypothetical protein